MAYEAVIGLECHIQLATRTKMFCGCPAEFGAAPNSNVCPTCLGLPGALPRTNRAAVDAALRLGLAVGCELRPVSEFARKNYFYPDMPKNYQITQYDRPLCEGGALPVALEGGARRFGLIRIHVEEDTGKSFHPERHGDRPVSRVDFNRAGVPLLELVSRPDFRAPAECAAFLTALRRLVRWLGISDADMEKGHLRCDANVSLRPLGQEAFGTKTEIKNLNSIKGVEKGLHAEIARQRALLESGGRIEQSTLLYDADHDRLAVMRSKEYAHDYRYFPDPDLPLLVVEETWIEDARGALPELPWAREARFATQYGLPGYDAAVLTETRELADYYEDLARGLDGKLASNWVMTEVLRAVKEESLTLAAWSAKVPAGRLRGLLAKVAARELPGPLAKQVFAWMRDEDGTVDELLERHGVRAQGSVAELEPLVVAVIEAHPGPVAQYLAGKTATLGFLVGQVMKRSGGQAVPQVVRELLEAELARRSGS
ncbi:MAG: glutaminyl-tRNA synthase (glutamine-hydrolyzing) subunit B [Candidatus Eisenbacteria bacterium RBG_16_71_46]|nr:MAG: glutaminyl-tRNA synthase (glutamine-hydrolyzing) subunit B [Candidatus Eisenbacteria bacterium RBG_16_71_46]